MTTVRTIADYRRVPAGTVVAEPGQFPYTKKGNGRWVDRYGKQQDFVFMCGTERDVLREGWGE